MDEKEFEPTLLEQQCLSMAYLAYCGEEIIKHSLDLSPIPQKILTYIEKAIPQIPPLCSTSGQEDWTVVWGPAIYYLPHDKHQDNAMFVAQKKSEPTHYIVSLRGTNSVSFLDWVDEDLEVLTKKPWMIPEGVSVNGSPEISKATHIGLDALLNKMTPVQGIPGEGISLAGFLAEIASRNPVDICFTGHSLGGALAPTLALWFKQSQGLPNHWDPQRNGVITTVSFAGATAGNTDFAAFFNQQFPNGQCDRIWNTLDIVPHAWETYTLKQMKHLYEGEGIKMTLTERVLVDSIIELVHDYHQVEQSNPFTWKINLTKRTYISQASIQHINAYPIMLKVPCLLDDDIIVK